MTWHAKISAGVPLGLLFIGLLLLLNALMLNWLNAHILRSQQISLLAFLMALAVLASVPVLVLLVYHTLGCLTLRYHLDRNGISARWFGARQEIPIRDIQRIVAGEPLGGMVVRRHGVRWPGNERGEGMVPGIGRTRFLSTQPLRSQLLVVAPGMAYGISPRDPEGFLQAFEARRELGPNRLLGMEAHRAGWLTWPLWTDQTAWVLLGLALLINLGLFAYLSLRFPGLDAQIPLHFNEQGMVDRIGARAELFALPIIGMIILVTNLVLGLALYTRERAGAYLLWGAAAAVQALFWLAVFSIGP